MDLLEQELKNWIQGRLNWKVPENDWNFNHDLFELGMDSLQAVQLRRFLLSFAPSPAAEQIPRDFVYQHPSIAKIAAALRAKEKPNPYAEHRRDMIKKYVELYSMEPLDREPPNLQRVCARPMQESMSVVLLTGATGSLGAHLLAHLASQPGVARVICLNRPNPE